MAHILLTLASGRRVPFEITSDLEGPAFFVLSVRKSGSTILNRICDALAKFEGRNFVNVGDTFFGSNVDVPEYVDDPALLALLRRGNVYGGFRNMPNIFLKSELFSESPKLLMVRDPRDALISEFFSSAYTHPIPQPADEDDAVTRMMEDQRKEALNAEIDEYVVHRARAMARTMLQYRQILGSESLAVLKYEDYIFNKHALIDVIARTFDWKIDDAQTDEILSWADIRPEKENPRSFIRKVTPGDHREKLRRDTIEIINEELRPAMEMFRYPR